MLGTNEGVTDTNLLQYLGVIEERTNDLLLTQAYVSSQKVSSGLLTQTYPAASIIFPFLCHLLYVSLTVVCWLQDFDDYAKRQPSLLGEGPQPVSTGPTIMPPAVG